MSSQDAFLAAQKVIPGGVNSPVRAFRSVGGTPRFIARAEGPYIFDVDGKRYIDYVGSYGPAIVGHAHPAIVRAVQEAATRGFGFGAPTEAETALAEAIVARVPAVEMVRLCNSGTEATMSALRLARGFTGRSKIVKFVGCYHGHSDSLLVDAGSGLATFGVPSSPGVTEGVAKDTITVPFNDTDAITRVMTEYGKDIACIIVEPVAGNMGCVLPENGYLDTLRTLTEKHGALLIFDEVMCGFRASLGGAQAAYGITPDLTCLGKIIGGGLPCAAYGGRRDIMEQIAPAGPVYQAGTLSGNPLAMTAGIETLKIILKEPEPGEADASRALTLKTKKLVLGLESAAREAGVKIQAHQAGSMFSLFFNEGTVKDYASSAASDQEAFKVWFRAMLEQGVYLAPSQFETLFLSLAHTDEDIDRTIAAAEKAFAQVKSKK